MQSRAGVFACTKHRRGVLTPYGAATPLCPSGFGCALLGGLAEVHREPAARQAARLGAPPPIWPRGACNAARPTSSTPF